VGADLAAVAGGEFDEVAAAFGGALEAAMAGWLFVVVAATPGTGAFAVGGVGGFVEANSAGRDGADGSGGRGGGAGSGLGVGVGGAGAGGGLFCAHPATASHPATAAASESGRLRLGSLRSEPLLLLNQVMPFRPCNRAWASSWARGTVTHDGADGY
jgi:hypothetical protein